MAIDYSKYDSRRRFRIANMAWLLCGRTEKNQVTYDDPLDVQRMQEALKNRIYDRFPERYPRGIPGSSFPKGIQVFCRQVWREITREMAEDGEIDGLPPLLFEEARGPASSSATELRYKHLLVEWMKAGPPEEGKTKEHYKAHAREEYGVGRNAFERSWRAAILATGDPYGWGKRGPRGPRKN